MAHRAGENRAESCSYCGGGAIALRGLRGLPDISCAKQSTPAEHNLRLTCMQALLACPIGIPTMTSAPHHLGRSSFCDSCARMQRRAACQPSPPTARDPEVHRRTDAHAGAHEDPRARNKGMESVRLRVLFYGHRRAAAAATEGGGREARSGPSAGPSEADKNETTEAKDEEGNRGPPHPARTTEAATKASCAERDERRIK